MADLSLVLENLDKPQLTDKIEALVMYLNRVVVLECPHLDVPWFRDRASKIFSNKGWFSDVMFLQQRSRISMRPIF